MDLKRINLENLLFIFSVLFIIIILVAKLALVFYLPIGFNEGVYGMNAQGLSEGKTLYKDLFDHKSPLIYYSLLFLITMIGDVAFAPHLLACLFDILLALSIFFVTKHYLNARKATIASALYLALSGSLAIYLDTEIPSAIFGFLGIFLYLKAKESHILLYFFSGMLLALSVWFKQTGVIFFGAIFLYEIYQGYRQKSWKPALKTIILVLLGIFIISMPLLTFFLYKSGYSFFFDVILFNMLFNGTTSRIVVVGKFLQIAAASIGILLISLFFKSQKYKEAKFLKFLIILVLISLAIAPEIFPNHLQQVFPFAILMFMLLAEESPAKLKKFIYLAIILLILSSTLTDLESLARNQRAGKFTGTFEATSYLKKTIIENATLFSDDPIYFYLLKKSNSYKLPGFAPSYVSVFNVSDFCEKVSDVDYLILTHRQSFIPKDELECALENFELEKKFEPVGESFLELWIKKDSF